MRKSLLVVTWTIWAIVFGVTGYLLTRVEYISDNESATVAAVYLLVLVLSFLTLAYITVPWRVPIKTVLVMEDTGVSSRSRNKLAGLSLVAVVIILATNLGLGTAIFGGEGASRNADMLGTERSSWRSTGSVPLNPIQVALALEPRDGRDEWRPANPGSYTDGDPSYTLRIWSAMLIVGGATSLASAFLWRRSVRRARDKGHLDLTYLLIGLSTLQLLGFAVSLMLIQELDKLASVPYYLTGIERLEAGGQIEPVQRLVTAYDALLYLGGGVLLVVACFTLATHTWYSVGDSLVAKISGAVLAVSVIYYLGFFEYAFSWLFFVGGIATLILLVHAGWQAYRGTEFISNQPGLGDSAES